ncbi:MAG TPA: hypothetical protein VG939_00700 [Caulobacteraceae bacterium]|nr:hypothetical protein [Caulobacteraceae bacterium]
MAQTLNIYLVNQAGDLGGLFEAQHRTTSGNLLKTFFEGCIKGVPRYDSVAVSWDGRKSAPTAFDFVCYVLTSSKDSIAEKKGSGGILGVSGSTVQADIGDGIISEVYLQQIVQGGDPRGLATANRENAVAACVMHELAHNLLDASNPVVAEVHKITGGVILRDTGPSPLQPAETPNAVDFSKMQAGFMRRAQGVKQYTDAMPA